MMKLMIVVSSLILACTSVGAQAPVTVDVSKITCDQFTGYKITSPRNIALWLNGYYNGRRGNTILDTQKLAENADKLEDYCFIHSKALVMQAVEELFGVKK
jgi:acid stress chaperone HdeB